MLRITLQGIRAHKRRVLATSSAVLLGVAFLAGTLVLTGTLRSVFDDVFTEANDGTDAVVRSAVEVGSGEFTERGLLPEGLVADVAATPGVAVAEPLVAGVGQIVGADGTPLGGNGPPTTAGNWVIDPDMNPYQLAEGRAPEAPGEVVIDRRSAEDGKLSVDDTTVVRTPEPIDVTVVGIATFGSADSQGPVTFAGFTTEFAQDVLLSEPGRVSGVAVAAEEGVSQDELVERLRPGLPADVEALTGAELTDEQRADIDSDFLSFFEAFLLAFAGIAVLVAAFSIYNTFSILVAQRTRESALLRALGASRRQVLWSVVGEALVVGLVASVLGIGAGIGLGAGLVALMDVLGFGFPSRSLVVGPPVVVTSLVVGVGVTLMASVAPAVRASRVAPLAAMRDVAVDRSAASRRRAVTGVAVLLAGVLATVAGTAGDGSLLLTGVGALLALVGVVVLGPVVARPVGAVLGGVLAVRGMSGRLARRNAVRNPRRTAATASALMVGVAIVTLFTVTAASLKTSVDEVVSEQFAGDMVIDSESFGDSGSGLSPGLSAALADLPEVAVATGLGDAVVTLDGRNQVATAIDPASLARVLDLDEVDGSIGQLGDDELALHEDFAEGFYAVGDVVSVGFADGAADELTVGAIFANNELMDDVVLPNAAWAPHAGGQERAYLVFVELADGVSPAAASPAIQAVTDELSAPDVQTRDEFVDSVASELDQMLTVVFALLALAILIALMGIANTLSLSIHERTRELGLLRAVGQSRRQLRSMVRGESIVVALFGTVTGLALGTFLGWTLVRTIAAVEGFGTFDLPVDQIAIVVVLGAFAGVLAAVRPARRAAKLDVLDAIASE